MFIIRFPNYDFQVKKISNITYIYDIIRKKYVILTPEEWVRQHIVHYLLSEKGYLRTLIAIEHSIELNSLKKRCDIVVFNARYQPTLLIECKKNDTRLTQQVFDQAGRYNLSLRVPYLAVTNGIENIVASLEHHSGTYRFLTAYPSFEELSER